MVHSPIQFGVVLPLSLLLVPQLEALERLDVVNILQSFPVVLHYMSCERLHVLLGAMGGDRGRRVETQEQGETRGKVLRGKRGSKQSRGGMKCGEHEQEREKEREGRTHQTS